MAAEPEASRLFELDRQYVWHPFTAMSAWMEGPDEPGRMIVEAEGFELIDSAGRRFIDGFSSLWCNLHGHRVAAIDSAIREQLGRVAHTTLLGHAGGPSAELAQRLVKIAPAGLSKVFYSDSGATAVEIALKMAFQYWRNRGQAGRTKFIALRQGYHGDTIGAVSVGGIEAFHAIFSPLLFKVTLLDSPNPYHHPAGAEAGSAVAAQLEQILAAEGEQYCAVIVEPLIQGAGGMLTHPQGFLAEVRRLTRKYGVLMIVDEVATGFCRTGSLFACQQEGVTPDLMCLGKGLTGGYLPVAATLASQDVFDAFAGGRDRTFYHGHTFTGNALGCAAGIASTDLIFSSGLMDALPGKVEYLRGRLARLADHRHVGDIRQCGMMAGIELMADRESKRPFDPAKRIGAAVCNQARRHGLIIRPLDDVIVLMPAPAMDLGTLERMMDAVETGLAEYFQ